MTIAYMMSTFRLYMYPALRAILVPVMVALNKPPSHSCPIKEAEQFG